MHVNVDAAMINHALFFNVYKIGGIVYFCVRVEMIRLVDLF